MKISSAMVLGLLLANALVAQAKETAPAKASEILVYRSPSCSCCGRWVEHMQKNNFTIKDIVTDEVQAIKDQYGVSAELASCHTAIIDGYVIEGHVPAQDVMALLAKKPAVVGLAVPGMVVGSPGMEMADKKVPYQVLSFDRAKHTQVFKDYQ